MQLSADSSLTDTLYCLNRKSRTVSWEMNWGVLNTVALDVVWFTDPQAVKISQTENLQVPPAIANFVHQERLRGANETTIKR